jgi:PKD repeat protein
MIRNSVLALFFAFAARAATSCTPDSAPFSLIVKNGTGNTVVGTLMVFNAAPNTAGFPQYTLSDCDTAQWLFNDGTPVVTQPAKETARHTFTHPGYYEIDVTISNALGSTVARTWVTIGTNPVTFITIKDATVAENAGALDFVLQRSNNYATTARIDYKTQSIQTGAFSRNLEGVAGSVIFAPGETQKTIHIRVQNDDVYGGDQIHYIAFTAVDGTFVDEPFRDPHFKLAMITVLDDETAPVATLIGSTRIIEGDARHLAHFDVVLSKPAVADTYLDYTLIDGTAKSGVDFLGVNGVALISGDHGSLDIPIVGNTTPEGEKTFVITLRGKNTTPAMPVINCSIINDDAGFVPFTLRVPAGARASLHFETGLPQTSAATLTFTSDVPDVAAPPAAITIPPGATSVEAPFDAKHDGVARIVAHFPGHFDTIAIVTVFEVAQLVFDPSPATFRIFTHGTLMLSIQPPRDVSQTVALESSNPSILTVPPQVVVPAGGSAAVDVDARFPGEALITARLSNAIDSIVSSVHVATVDAFQPQVAGVIPAIAPPEGGASVKIAGTNITTRCGVTFGGVAATNVFSDSTGMTVRTPPHAIGVVDVEVNCSGLESVLSKGFQFAHARRHA